MGLIKKKVSLFGIIVFLCGFGFYLQRPPTIDIKINKLNYHNKGAKAVPYDVVRNNSIFVHSAFRVSDTEIRISLIRRHLSRTTLHYKLGDTRGKVVIQCALDKCLDFFSKPCNMIGNIGIIKNDTLPDHNTLYLYVLSPDSKPWVSIDVKDVRVRPNHKYPHQLGVCVQPIYLHADYTLFINFFEFWLNQGATKFYIYRESYTAEVQEILDFYEQRSNASIELIDWSTLPYDDKVTENFNTRVYRLEMMLSIFDCIHRARSHVKFVAQTDLDEMVYVHSGITVAQVVEKFVSKRPDTASISFQSQRVAFEPEAIDSFTSPQTIQFSYLENVQIENYVFPRPLYSKIIYRPERVYRVHSHKQKPAELIPNSKKFSRYSNAIISSTDAVILHMRLAINGHFRMEKHDDYKYACKIRTSIHIFFPAQTTGLRI
uniref:Glycosyltransferase family 92 protein n=1 Tax=Panagrellus redivivus TaxID=6233 RepID=A0A7E4V348_PANRE